MPDSISRVYLLVEKLEPVGGVAEQVTLLALELARRGVDTWLFVRRVLGADNQYARRLRPSPVHVVTCPPSLHRLDPRRNWRTRTRIVRALSWLTYPGLAPIAAVDALRRQRPLARSWAGAVGSVRGRIAATIMCDRLEHAFERLLTRYAAASPPDVVDVSGSDCVASVSWARTHGLAVVYRQTSLPTPEEPWDESHVVDLHRASCVMAVSRAVADGVRSLLRDDRPVYVVPNAVPDPGRAWDRNNGHHGQRAGPALVVCLSRLSDEKGVQHIPDVAARVLRHAPKTRFLVAGDGPLLRDLVARCRRDGLGDDVRFLGGLPHDTALDLLRRADVMFLPSRREGMPVTAIEAMALGKAMVVTSVGGTPELVQDGVSALLVPPDDGDAMACALLRVIGDPALAERLGAAARRAYEQGPYRPATVADLTLAVYRRAIASERTPAGVALPSLERSGL